MDLLRAGPAPSQELLARALARMGLRATQATISRDLHALGVIKGPAGYTLPESVVATAAVQGPGGEGNELDALLRRHAVSIVPADSLVVVRTAPGHANLLALAFDRWPPDQALGTVAGDDTIFIATASRAAARRLTARLLARAGLRPRSRAG